MKLKCEDGRTFENPTPELIEQILRELGSPGTAFVILLRDDGIVQASADSEQLCDLEYNIGPEDNHLRCTNNALAVDDIISVFKACVAHDDSWIQRFEWMPLDEMASYEPVDPSPWQKQKRGCLSMLLLAMAVSAVIIWTWLV